MIELLRYLEANGFTNYITSGRGRDFMRPITQELYGIAPERIIGSTVALAYRDDGDVGKRHPHGGIGYLRRRPAKPVRIWSRIGRRPIFAGGNSKAPLRCCTFASIHRSPL